MGSGGESHGRTRAVTVVFVVLISGTVASGGIVSPAVAEPGTTDRTAPNTPLLGDDGAGDELSSDARETGVRDPARAPGVERPGRATRTLSGDTPSEAVQQRTTLSFESGVVGETTPPDPWFLLSDPSNVDRNDVAEVSDAYASDGRRSMHIGSYDPDELDRIRVGVFVNLSGVDTVVYDGYVEANNPNWGDIKLNVDSTTVSNELVGDSPPEDRWYRDVTADVSAYEGTHLLYFWVRGDGNDVYLDNVRFRDGSGERVPVSRVVLPMTEYTFDPLDSYAFTTTNLTIPEANLGLNNPYAVADATVNGTRGTSSITASAGSDGVLGIGTGAEGALGRTRLGFVCNASRDGTYVVSSEYTTTGELSYFRGGSGGLTSSHPCSD